MSAIDFPSSSPWIRVQDRHLPSPASSPPKAAAETNRNFDLETILPINTTGMKRSRERPMRPSRRIVAAAHPLESIAQLGSTNRGSSTESIVAKPVTHATASNDESWKTRWQEIDLPDELLQVPSGTQQEICAIVKESFNQSRAIRASLLETYQGQTQTELPQIDRDNPSLKPELHTDDSSVMSRERTVSSHSDATASSRDSHRLSTGGQSFDSFTSAESMLSLPLTPRIVPLSSSLCTDEPGLEKRPKRHGLFSKLLRGRELKMKSVALKSSTSVTEVIAVTKECASCFDDVLSNDAIGLDCQHSYCSPCFTQLVTTAMQHENFWPPKCCLQNIPKGTLEGNLSALNLAKYNLKSKEYATPAGERCYTCGSRWRTCACTEEDQIRRRDELAARRAIVNAEEAEVQAAIEAVAEAERREIEEAIEQERRRREIAEHEERERVAQEEARLAEEMQRLNRLEAARVEAINSHYAVLRTSLHAIHQAQRKAISTRHTAKMGSTQHDLEEIASQEVALLDEQNRDKLAWEERIQGARLKNAREIIETSTRHRADQDEYLTKFVEHSKEGAFDEVTKANMIEELAIIQESEREALRSKHRRDIRKLQARAIDAPAIDQTVQKSALQQEKQVVTKAIEELKVRMYSDTKWLELVTHEREAMLTENEHQLISSGADVPLSAQVTSDFLEGTWPLESLPCRLQAVEGIPQRQAVQVDWIMTQ
ncbi:hypothetical protein MMC18_003402 [Xylographa bjoerkii]|nr:hypothetical protein [Xylographa bjoerkii]